MQIKHFLLLAFMAFASVAYSKTDFKSTPFLNASILKDTCDLLPPIDFHVTETGTTWVKFAWAVTSPSISHKIKTYRASDNFLLNTTNVPAGNFTAMVQNLPAATNVYSTINAVCSNGVDGVCSPIVSYRTLILDLLADGYTPGSQSYCTINSTNYLSHACTFKADGTITPFMIKRNNDTRQFGVAMVNENGQEKFKVYIGPQGNGGSPKFTFYCGNQGPNCTTSAISVKWVSPLGESSLPCIIFDMGSGTSNIANLWGEYFISNAYTIERMAPDPTGRPSNSVSDRDFVPIESYVSAFPNPFSNTLDVYIGNGDAQKIQLQMFDLSGRAVLDQQFVGGQDQYTLPTETLSPGFYFLRIDVDGNVQTLKVAKSE